MQSKPLPSADTRLITRLQAAARAICSRFFLRPLTPTNRIAVIGTSSCAVPPAAAIHHRDGQADTVKIN